jgi:hypothetical protein
MGGGDDSSGLSKEEQKEQERLRSVLFVIYMCKKKILWPCRGQELTHI